MNTGKRRIIILFSDDSTLFFACRMRDVLNAIPGPKPSVELAWYLGETELSYRQLSLHLPEGPEHVFRAKQLTDLMRCDSVDAILTSRVYKPLNQQLRKAEIRHLATRPCVVSFLGGLDFYPEMGYFNRKDCDVTYLFPRTAQAEFTQYTKRLDTGWRDVGFGHPSFLRPRPVSLETSADTPSQLSLRCADPHRGWQPDEARLPSVDPSKRSDVFFFAQAISPLTKRSRIHVAKILNAIALANPSRDIWIKLRHLPGENSNHKHQEKHDYPSLLKTLPNKAANLHVTACSMDQALETAALGITCTSTAAIDIVRASIPCMVYLDYVDNYADPLSNPMRALFKSSGLVTSLEDLLNLRANSVNPDWIDDMFCPRDLGSRVMASIEEFENRPFQIQTLPEHASLELDRSEVQNYPMIAPK